MRVAFSNRSVRQYGKLPPAVQARFDKQLAFLLANLQHPSLRAKKYDEAANIWQARVNDHYRFYFQIHGDTYRILSITGHPK
jgi:mRNA-degrading endonuclease RelE of RelBE toxin-antitoxin system